MNKPEKSEKQKDNRQRDFSPRPNISSKRKKRTEDKVIKLDFRDSVEINRVKRYFIGKELQKVWLKVSYTGRQKIIKHYSSINIIITENSIEEPDSNEDNSLPCYTFELEEDNQVFDYPIPNQPSENFNTIDLPFISLIYDFSALLIDPSAMISPNPLENIQLIYEVDNLTIRRVVDPYFSFYEFISDDTLSKVFFVSLGCPYYSKVLQR